MEQNEQDWLDEVEFKPEPEGVEYAEIIPDEKQYWEDTDGTKYEIINGRVFYTPTGRWRFVPGNKLGEKARGVQQQKLPDLRKDLNVSNWNKLKDFINNEGIEKFVEEMQQLDGREYIAAYLGIVPFVKGKIANKTEDRDDVQKKIDKRTHTITIRDMRDNSQQEVELT